MTNNRRQKKILTCQTFPTESDCSIIIMTIMICITAKWHRVRCDTRLSADLSCNRYPYRQLRRDQQGFGLNLDVSHVKQRHLGRGGGTQKRCTIRKTLLRSGPSCCLFTILQWVGVCKVFGVRFLVSPGLDACFLILLPLL